MQFDTAWREYLAASQHFAAASDRLLGRLRFFVGDPPSAPRTLSSDDTDAWLGLTIDVEEAATMQRHALEDFIKARATESR
jgi:hypothetical protein